MKLGKIVSFVITTAAAAVCGAALLSVSAGAIKVPAGYTYTTDGGTTFNEITTLDQYLYRYGQLYDGDHNYVGPESSELTLDASDGDVTLNGVQLGYISGKGLSKVTIKVNTDEYNYNVILKDKNVNFFSGGTFTSGADFRLLADTSRKGTLKLYTGNSVYTSGHPFVIQVYGDLYGEGLFRRLLNEASVDMSDRLRVYTYDNPDGSQKEKNIKVIYSKDADYDLNLTFGSGINNYYYTKYDKTVLHLYNQSNIQAYIEQKVAELSGMTLEQAYYDSAVRSRMESVKKSVIGRFFKWDPAANDWQKDETVYLTAADIDPLINEYFGGTGTSGNAAVNTQQQQLSELIKVLVASGDYDRMIENALYNVFGWDINSITANELKTEIADTVTGKLIGAGATADNYRTLAQYFINDWATEEYRILKAGFEEVKTILDSTNTKYASLSAVMQEVSAIRSLIGRNPSTNTAYTLAETLQLIKTNSSRVSSLISSTAAVTTNDIANILVGTQTTVPVTYNNYTPGTETYVTGQAYATKSELTNYINSLNSTINDLQNQINSLKNSVNSTANSISVYDWIKTTPYGDVDTFMNAVADLVAKKIGSGESAYEIAVRNGFQGTEKAWLNSLVGESAYEIALDNGFQGTEKAWLNSLKADGITDDDKVVYFYEQKFNSAAPAETDDEEVVISEGDDTVSAIPINMTTETNFNVSDTKPASTRNPSTGVVAGILIPAGAAACIFLIKKDKRRRGRK